MVTYNLCFDNLIGVSLGIRDVDKLAHLNITEYLFLLKFRRCQLCEQFIVSQYPIG